MHADLPAASRVIEGYLDIETQLGPAACDNFRQLVDAELLSELVEHAELPSLGRIFDRNLDAAHLQGTQFERELRRNHMPVHLFA